MGGVCSRKRDPQVNEDNLTRGVSGRYSKSRSSKWLGNSFSRPAVDNKQGKIPRPSLMELCIYKICKDIDKHTTFSMLPRDISQQIFNELVYSQCLTEVSLQAFRDCALQDLDLGEYPGLKDSWMDVISSQGSSLLSVDLSGSDVTDSGLIPLKSCTNLQALNFNYCDQISDHGLAHIRVYSRRKALPPPVVSALTADPPAFDDFDLANCVSSSPCSIWFEAVFLCLVLRLSFSLKGYFLFQAKYAYEGYSPVPVLLTKISETPTELNVKLNTDDVTRSNLAYDVHVGSQLVPTSRSTHWTALVSLSLLQPLSIVTTAVLFRLLMTLSSISGCSTLRLIVTLFVSLSNLTTLSFRRNNQITAQGLNVFAGLINLLKLDLERCPGIHGGLVHLKGLAKLESLNIKCCNCITDADMKPLSGLTNLKELQISCSKVSDYGISFLGGLHKLSLLNMEGCPAVTAACLDSLAAIPALLYLNLSRCNLSDDGCEKFSGLRNLKVLNLGFNDISDACLVHMRGLQHLRCLELSDTAVGSNGLRHLSGLTNLESINLSFTDVTDGGLRKLSGLSSLKSLNLDARQITDAGLSALTSLTGLTHLDLFGARITDSGTNYLRNFKNLRSLEICGGGLTDAGVKNIKDLSSLTVLNLSQNGNLTDKSLEMISGLRQLISLNVSNSRITSAGLKHLRPLKNLKSLTLESCKVTVNDIKRLQTIDLPNLVSFRPE
ncbi:hypothetical protein HYC85_004399 [Camellia sinensis]|uniref:F-box domain-containing protein n=1 Tax=Camellia sinensis TaxID=4442 RepID=A0A7J7HYJ3_CAMSI|nr:hypothetical protein HYC85_004399 [Camellia sinensis]